MSRGLVRALRAVRGPTFALILVHSLGVSAGALMVHAGSRFALGARDAIVGHALRTDPASRAYDHGARYEAAAWDFSRNLLLGAVPATVGGLAIVIPFFTAAYRGWVGGIVAVDGHHRSRLRDARSAAYYLLTVLLQLVPYCLAGGAGVRLGFAYLRARGAGEERWLGLPKEALRDVIWVYALVVPLLLVASAWEFLSAWNV